MSKPRSIFEDVSGEEKRPDTPKPGGIDRKARGARGAIVGWLLVLFTLVVAIILVGGLTRLTDSGLSITEWAPIQGVLPPMGEAAWLAEFEKYKQIPEFTLQNSGMDLAAFKTIYWWEWGHRLLARLVGLVWALGFLYFWLRKQIPPGWTGRLLMLGVLGGLQGVIGWWMVYSGLSGRMVDVAPYRLAIHLGLAFTILGFITWFALSLSRSEADLLQARRQRETKLFSLGTGLMHFSFLQILLGALVAGTDAGRAYIDWPLMGGQIIPDNMFGYSPWWRNFFENQALVQFLHRLAGYGLVIFAFIVWRRAAKVGNNQLRGSFNVAILMVFFQVVLGIVTVIYAAPLSIAIVHQLGAIILWVLILRARHAAQYPKQQKIEGT